MASPCCIVLPKEAGKIIESAPSELRNYIVHPIGNLWWANFFNKWIHLDSTAHTYLFFEFKTHGEHFKAYLNKLELPSFLFIDIDIPPQVRVIVSRYNHGKERKHRASTVDYTCIGNTMFELTGDEEYLLQKLVYSEADISLFNMAAMKQLLVD